VRRSDGAEVRFALHVRKSNWRGTPPLVQFKAACGPGDDGEPVIIVSSKRDMHHFRSCRAEMMHVPSFMLFLCLFLTRCSGPAWSASSRSPKTLARLLPHSLHQVRDGIRPGIHGNG